MRGRVFPEHQAIVVRPTEPGAINRGHTGGEDAGNEHRSPDIPAPKFAR
jgi:hypothetical protein